MNNYALWQADGEVLAEIGRSLFMQDLRITVRLPAGLAAQALASWQREESNAPLATDESHAQRIVRHRGASLALIGLSIESESSVDGGDVVLDLDAW